MKKKLKSMKGFAMAELLAVSLVILVLFSVLFSNYLPLVAEYENRIMYNDVSAQYAAYYVRQIVKDAIDKNNFSTGITTINDDDYVSLFKYSDEGNADNRICELASSKYNEEKARNSSKYACNKMLALYGIKEVIVTKYSLADLKNRKKYKQSDGSLYEYIQYLPKYENTIYTEENDLYRIILKADNKYATTPVKVDYTTPGKCFTGTKDSGNNLTITGYNEKDSDCGKEVVISTKQISIKDSSGNTITGIIKKIGDNAFNGKDINSIDFGNVTEIGESAFENSNLSNINSFKESSVTSIDASAFKNTKLEDVKLPDNLASIGDAAFSSIKTLKSISLTNKDIYGTTSDLFSGSGTPQGIDVQFLSNIKTVGEKMFYNANIKLMNFGGIVTIKKEAFAMKEDNSGISLPVSIPPNVTTIEESAFENRKIDSLSFSGAAQNRRLTTVSKRAFAMSNDNNNSSLSNVKIPFYLTDLGESAFENRKIKILNIPYLTNIELIPKKAFYNCGIEQLNNSNIKITTIEESAFDKNNFNTKVNIPATVTSIGQNAFPMITGSEYSVGKKTWDVVTNWCDVFRIDNCIIEPADENNIYVIRDEVGEKTIFMYVGQ